ncbi:MAG TPA: serine hydroxymethyltransferase [Actinobacteria bacterium]|nr:serine hydroxymethyltransferase [Actinomycetota bacterium]
MEDDWLSEMARDGYLRLRAGDPALHDMLAREYRRQSGTLSLVASSSLTSASSLAALSSVLANVTAEGYPGGRYHAGCEVVDEIERLAVERAKSLFGADYANVQPHSATTANFTALSSLLRPGDTILGMALSEGGHLTHGSPVSFSGQYFNPVTYGTTADGLIDYEQVSDLAGSLRPKLIICGATTYPREIDFGRFREIADAVGAYLLADISHTAGLVAAGLHQSPINRAHLTTTCTHKQLFGPRGGMIMSGRDSGTATPSGTLAGHLNRAVFPFSQGAPAVNTIAAKAAALGEALQPAFAQTMRLITETAHAMAVRLMNYGYNVVSGGTGNHIVLIDLTSQEISGLVAERALEECLIIVNKNRIRGDHRPPSIASGIRIGTNTIAQRGMSASAAESCADLIHFVLSDLKPAGDKNYYLAASTREKVRTRVRELCAAHPIEGAADL